VFWIAGEMARFLDALVASASLGSGYWVKRARSVHPAA